MYIPLNSVNRYEKHTPFRECPSDVAFIGSTISPITGRFPDLSIIIWLSLLTSADAMAQYVFTYKARLLYYSDRIAQDFHLIPSFPSTGCNFSRDGHLICYSIVLFIYRSYITTFSLSFQELIFSSYHFSVPMQ
jgi:hypothetical protein